MGTQLEYNDLVRKSNLLPERINKQTAKQTRLNEEVIFMELGSTLQVSGNGKTKVKKLGSSPN